MKKVLKFLADVSGEVFTFLTLFVTWIFTTGAAKVVVGKATLICIGLWAVLWPLRNSGDE